MNRVAIDRRKRFYAGLVEQGMRSATAIVLEQSPNLTYGSAGETARRMLKDIETRPEFKAEQAQIADLKELDEIATDFVRRQDKPDQTRLKALELSYRRKGALIDRSINENHNVDETQEALERASQRALDGARDLTKVPIV